MAFEPKTYLAEVQRLVESKLDDVLAREPGVPPVLRDAMRYSLLAPGKRLRPALVRAASELAGGTWAEALPAACAVEMIHTYSLIHDDLPAMDDDDLRRGLPTCHKKFGESIAILAGDALLTLAFQVLAEHYPPRTGAGCCAELARGAGAAGMVAGQVEDLAWERADQREGPRSLAALEKIHQLKTGALFRAALRVGVWAAQGERGPSAELLTQLDTFGHCFGLVFQITDDLIDVEGNAADSGKRTQKDAGRGKLTYPGLLGVEESRRHARELCAGAMAALESAGHAATPLIALMDLVRQRDR